MITGELTNIGTLDVDGEECTGVFVTVPKDQLRALGRTYFGEQVVVSPAQAAESEPTALRAIALLERWLKLAHDLDLKVYPPLLEETAECCLGHKTT